MKKDLRRLPAVHRILNLPGMASVIERWGHQALTDACREALEEIRRQEPAEGGPDLKADPTQLVAERSLEILLRSEKPSYAGVINATGVLLHTNLGRAPQVEMDPGRYLALEFDLKEGKRGQRLGPIRKRLASVCSAESAVMVNNNAASLLLILQVMALRREVIVSRSQLIEIGGSFRLPAVMEAAGCRLIEVGCTNRVHLRDFEEAIGENTAAILVAHQSNFRILGFTASPEEDQLAQLAHSHDLPLIVDQGSGCLYDLRKWALPEEKTVGRLLKDGADLVCFSGDKLLGGPQAGLIVGTRKYIEPLASHPLYRCLRPGKMALQSMDRVLRAHESGRLEEIPLYAMLELSVDTLKKRARSIARRLRARGMNVENCAMESTLGGGTTPGAGFPSWGLRLQGGQSLLDALRMGETPVIACLSRDHILLDLRTVAKEEEPLLMDVLIRAYGPITGGHNNQV